MNVKKLLDPNQPIDYSSANVPTTYACSICGTHGVKLWREYSAGVQYQTLRCARCAALNQGVSVDGMDRWGRHLAKYDILTDHIGDLLPAIPTPDNDQIWGYGAAPPEGLMWWASLPNELPRQPRAWRGWRRILARMVRLHR